MKKLLLTIATVALAVSLHAQGTVTFNNSSATKITNSVTGQAAAGVNVGLYYSSNLGATRNSLTLEPGAVTNTLSGASAGLFIGSTRTISTVPANGTIVMQLRAWSGAFGSYEAALAGGSAADMFGESPLFTVGPLGGGTTPTPSITGVGKLTAFTVAPVPEPSSIALGLLGLGAVALFRRRK